MSSVVRNEEPKTDNPFLRTKTGLIGLQRDTMLESELQYLVIRRQYVKLPLMTA